MVDLKAIKNINYIVLVTIIVVGLAGTANADSAKGSWDKNNKDCWIGIMPGGDCDLYNISTANHPAWLKQDKNSGQFYVNVTELPQYDQHKFLLSDVNEQDVLDYILNHTDEDPNEPGQRIIPSGGGGGGGSINTLFGSNGDAGFNGSHSLMSSSTSASEQPVTQYTPARTDTLFATPSEPVEVPVVEPEPYIPVNTEPVPEPTSICLLGLGGIAMLRKRKK